MRVVDQVVHRAAEHFIRRVAQHLGAGFVDEDAAPVEVNAVDAFAGRFENHLQLAAPGSVVRKLVQVGEHGGQTNAMLPA